MHVEKMYQKGVQVNAYDSQYFEPTKAVYVGGAGDMTVTFADGSVATLKAVLAGQIYELQITQIRATGTTATNFVLLY